MPDARQNRICELLTHLGLWERRKEPVSGWSRGMKQKLAIVRTLLHRPELIFLDEPTAGLDPVAAAALRGGLANLAAREGVTVILTTHNLAEAEKLCQQVGVIRQGQLITVGSPEERRARQGAPRLEIIGRGFSESLLASLLAQPEVSGVEQENNSLQIELSRAVDTARLVNLIVAAGAQVEEVRRANASLEDVFLTLMEDEK